MFMFALRQRYDSPHDRPLRRDRSRRRRIRCGPASPARSRPTARSALQHAMATLFALADRGRGDDHRRTAQVGPAELHAASPARRSPPLAPEETAVLDLAFRHKGQTLDQVSLTQARTRIASRLRELQDGRESGTANARHARRRTDAGACPIPGFRDRVSADSPGSSSFPRLSWRASTMRGRSSSSAPSPPSPSSASSSTVR